MINFVESFTKIHYNYICLISIFKVVIIKKGINYDGNNNYGNYLNKEIHSSFTLMNIDEAAINKIIYNLPPKVVVDVMVFPPNC